MNNTVFIPCAGLGTRLGNLTKYLPKPLVSIQNVPAITKVFKQFPKNSNFVIALGFQGNLLREYIELAHSDLNIQFVNVDCFEGPGSGLGFTLLCAEPLLRKPFIFCSCDTLFTGSLPPDEINWIGWGSAINASNYRTAWFSPDNSNVLKILPKSHPGSTQNIYIGLARIQDWKIFWDAIKDGGNDAIMEGEAYGLGVLCEKMCCNQFYFDWIDVGSCEGLNKANNVYGSEVDAVILPKEKESIWFFDDQVIKFHQEKEFIKNRVERSNFLEGFVPSISRYSDHFFQYKKVEGNVYSRIACRANFSDFLSYCQKFWQKSDVSDEYKTEFKKQCLHFYQTKTLGRLRDFYEQFKCQDNAIIINGVCMPTLANILDKIDWDWISSGLPGRFHGDFHFENILKTDGGNFVFVDWRQDFCGNLEIGDIYYDLAKLYHGIIVNHNMINQNLFHVDWVGDKIAYDFHRYQRLVECEKDYFEWLSQEGYDCRKVKLITGLIFLNIASLHHHPYCLLLYALGKTLVFREAWCSSEHN